MFLFHLKYAILKMHLKKKERKPVFQACFELSIETKCWIMILLIDLQDRSMMKSIELINLFNKMYDKCFRTEKLFYHLVYNLFFHYLSICESNWTVRELKTIIIHYYKYLNFTEKLIKIISIVWNSILWY